MSFAKNLRELRNKKGISQEELAAKLHISRQAISRYENGTAEPSIDMLNDICIILDVSIDRLIGGRKEIAEFRQYSSLTKSDKRLLWYDFAKTNRWNTFILVFILLMINCLGFGLIGFFATNIAQSHVLGEETKLYQIAAIGGAVLLIIGAILLLIYNSIICSMKFNRWLKNEHNIIRQRKLMIL